MCSNDCMIDPLYIMGSNIEQIQSFYKDIIEMDNKIVRDEEYEIAIANIRDETELLRAEYSVLYSTLLDKIKE